MISEALHPMDKISRSQTNDGFSSTGTITIKVASD